MVHRHQAAFFFTPFKHREIYYPKTSKLVLITQSQLLTHFQTQFTKLFPGLHGIIAGQYQNQIARFSSKSFFHLLKHLLCIEFVNTRFYRTIGFYTCIYHSFGTDLRSFYEFRQCIQLLTGIACSTFGTNTADIGRIVEYGKAVTFHDIHQLYEFHSETQVRFVTAVIFHGIAPRHAYKRLC